MTILDVFGKVYGFFLVILGIFGKVCDGLRLFSGHLRRYRESIGRYRESLRRDRESFRLFLVV